MIGYQQPQPQQQFQPQGNALIIVRSEQEARNYPTAHGASLTFKNENEPYLYTKTLGFSQMDVPVFERFRLVREDTPAQIDAQTVETVNGSGDELKRLKTQINALQEDVKSLLEFRAEFGGDLNDE